MDLHVHGQTNAACESRPDHLLISPVTGLPWIVLECGFHVKL